MCFTFFLTAPAQAAGRIALLLSAEDYSYLNSSQVPVSQSGVLASALEDKGFDVSRVVNPTNAAARAALSDFSRRVEAADFALVVVSGHFATYRKQSYFLPVNARIRRATDLFSRGLAASNIANIAQPAEAGALLFVSTVANIPTTVAGVDARPDMTGELGDNLVAVFSSSAKVPVSRIDRISVRAMADVVKIAGERPMMLTALLDAASAGGSGLVFGKLKDRDLSKDTKAPAETSSAEATAQARAETDAERRARLLAESRLTLAEERVRAAEERAKKAEERARRGLEKAAAEQRAAAVRRSAAVPDETQSEPKVSTPPKDVSRVADLQSLQVVEALLGRGQRRTIQRILRREGFYKGPIDAIFGDLTRKAIRAFQSKAGAEPTGYLTPDQLKQLVAMR